ncbi:MAG: alanine--glyoxylate aminotransferase family protein [Planctomycetes bacterium]|nr:alanine--glyoxylate aminotransferase family protein [Planctomycetota bacterium]
MLIKPRVLTPGPTALLPQGAGTPLHHRSPEFEALLGRVREGLKAFFSTTDPVLVLACSGTGGMEAAAMAAAGPGEPVVCVNGGKFGARWVHICATLGMKVTEVAVPSGEAVTPAQVADALKRTPGCRALFVQGCESSTGVLHPVAEIATLTRALPDCLLVVDGITWLGAHTAAVGELGLDLVVCASQKALALPPGLAMVSVSARARRRMQQVLPRSCYLDLRRELEAQARNQTAFTPAISLVAQLDESLRWVAENTLARLVANAALLAEMTRAAAGAMDLRLFARRPANSITALEMPANVDAGRVAAALRERFGLLVSDGQDSLKGRLLRVAHLGYCDYADTLALVAGLETVLPQFGHKVAPGRGLAAAQRVLAGAKP